MNMNIETLDQIFPYFVFIYGALVSSVLASDSLSRLAETKLPSELRAQLFAHRPLAAICLWVGALWVLQDLWFG